MTELELANSLPSETRQRNALDTFLEQPTGKLLAALSTDFQSMPLIWKFSGVFHAIAILSIIAYFNDETPIDLEQVIQDAQAGTGSMQNVPRGAAALKTFFAASKKVNPLFVLPPMIFVSTLAGLDWISKNLIKSKFLLSLWHHSYAVMARNFADPRWIRDYTLDVRPLLLTWACLVPPVGISLVLLNTLYTIAKSITGKTDHNLAAVKDSRECLVIPQRIDTKRKAPQEFYNSTWFNPVVALPYVCAVPASITLAIYFNMGVDALLGFPSADPKFHIVFVVIGLYIYGLSCCLSTLFMRSYFTFCWNFMSSEYDLEIYSDRIKRLPIKGWFLDFMQLAGRQPASQILWKDVKSIKFRTGSLKIDNTKNDLEALAVLRKIAYFYESLAKKMEIHTDYLEIVNSFGRSIEIRLWELSAAQKLKLFESIITNCPSVYLDENVQKALVGSSVMKEPQYTQIWFEVLASTENKSLSGQLQIGQELKGAKYTIASTIATGGQAVLYEAKCNMQEAVVLKEFQLTPGESFGAKIESAKDFENESAILGQLDHEGIVKMLDMFYENGRVYIALEHIEGLTLRQLVTEKGPMQEQKILDLCKQMCSILEYLHKQQPPIVHRDFTPDNVMLQPNGKIKLIDFSVAERRRKKQSSDCAGKHAYTPPEQFAGNACSQSDIYALGATLFYLATGSDPLPISVALLPDDLRKEMSRLAHIIEKCTQLELADRYESTYWIFCDLS